MKALDVEIAQQDFWSDHEHAKDVQQRRAALQDEVDAWNALRDDTDAALDIAQTSQDTGDHSLKEELEKTLADLMDRFGKLEFSLMLSGPYDVRNAIVSIHAGSGGTEAQDWAEMLLRMMLRYAERKEWGTKLLARSDGEEAGIKSATFDVRGAYAYGYLKAEAGVHRLVRISPFDADKQRHTSFALIEVIPDLGEVEDIEIDENDLRIDTFMASGHGGQSVNTTYSAVRIVHLPTNITISCQNERSQQQNRETAMKILKSKLHLLKLEEQQKEKQKLRGEYHSAEWGNQIRSYVLQPYRMVKDHRTKYEMSDTEAVLDGDLDPFIEAYLKWQAAGSTDAKRDENIKKESDISI